MGLALINFSENSYPYHQYDCWLCFFSVIYLSTFSDIPLYVMLKPGVYRISCPILTSTLIVTPDYSNPLICLYHPKRLCVRKIMTNENDSNSPG